MEGDEEMGRLMEGQMDTSTEEAGRRYVSAGGTRWLGRALLVDRATTRQVTDDLIWGAGRTSSSHQMS